MQPATPDRSTEPRPSACLITELIAAACLVVLHLRMLADVFAVEMLGNVEFGAVKSHWKDLELPE